LTRTSALVSARRCCGASRRCGRCAATEEHRTLVEGSDSTAISNYHGALAPARLAEGRYAEAAAEWERSADLNDINAPMDLPKAARATLWAGRRDEMERLMRRFTDLRAHGPAPEASMVTLRAAAAGLEARRDDSLDLYADALARWDAAGLPLDRAFTAIDMLVVLGPDEPAARAAAEEARELFTRLAARRLLEILDRAMSGSPAAQTTGSDMARDPVRETTTASSAGSSGTAAG
jgi:tetratricopeptide (TPR) repeat protein